MRIIIIKKTITKILLLSLTVFFCLSPNALGNRDDVLNRASAENLKAAVSEYHKGSYKKAINRLEPVLRSGEEIDPPFRAKIYLLLGACYEKLGREKIAEAYFLELKEMLDKEMSLEHPVIEGIEPGDFLQYREVFSGSSFFTFKEPVPVSEMIERKVIHAPRKTLEEKEKEKKKKKFPWLVAVGGVVLIGIVTVLLLSRKKGSSPTFEEVQWVRIPAGKFLMGDNFNEGEADELPVHEVYLDEYHISKYEITIEQYSFFCDETGRRKPVELNPSADFWDVPQQIGEPIYLVSWYDAQAFCTWLSRRNGKNIRLPTEAQWEKAARGAKQYRYPWGNNSPDCSLAMYKECQAYSSSRSGLVTVDSGDKGKSPYGLHHMAGNVSEWCRDIYDPAYYSTSAKKNPKGPGNGFNRVIRGGGRFSSIYYIRSANRDYDTPGCASVTLGFRVVMED